MEVYDKAPTGTLKKEGDRKREKDGYYDNAEITAVHLWRAPGSPCPGHHCSRGSQDRHMEKTELRASVC